MEAPRSFSTGVDPSWLDYNDHVTDAAYAQIAAAANEELEADLGFSEAYLRATGRAFYTAQATIRYLNEITAGSTIAVLRTITRLGTRSMTITTQFHVGDRVAAATEHVYVMTDVRGGGRSSPLTDEERGRLEPWLDKPV